MKLEKAWSAKGTKKYILVQIFSRLASGCSSEFLWGIPMNCEWSERSSPLSPGPLGMPSDAFIWLQKAESLRRGIEALKNCEWDAPSCQITETKPLSGNLEGSRAPGMVFRVWWEVRKCREVRKGGYRDAEKWVFGFLLPPFLGNHETITTQVLRTNCWNLKDLYELYIFPEYLCSHLLQVRLGGIFPTPLCSGIMKLVFIEHLEGLWTLLSIQKDIIFMVCFMTCFGIYNIYWWPLSVAKCLASSTVCVGIVLS